MHTSIDRDRDGARGTCVTFRRFPRMTRPFTLMIHWLFVDSQFVHRFWHCHRIPNRSFFVGGRQLHVCARCTGLISGFLISGALIPAKDIATTIFVGALLLLVWDGVTQIRGERESTNALRFCSGLLVGATALPAIIALTTRALHG